MKARRCNRLRLFQLQNKVWHRAIRTAHQATTPLGYLHSRTISGRFNAGSIQRPLFPVLYLADDPQTCLFEVHALLGSPLPGLAFVPNPTTFQNWVVIDVTVNLRNVADLTRPRERRRVDTSAQELTGDWLGYGLRNPYPVGQPPFTNVPTQILGDALFRANGIEAVMTLSARNSTRTNLLVFPTKLLRGSTIRYTSPSGTVHTIHAGGAITP